MLLVQTNLYQHLAKKRTGFTGVYSTHNKLVYSILLNLCQILMNNFLLIWLGGRRIIIWFIVTIYMYCTLVGRKGCVFSCGPGMPENIYVLNKKKVSPVVFLFFLHHCSSFFPVNITKNFNKHFEKLKRKYIQICLFSTFAKC